MSRAKRNRALVEYMIELQYHEDSGMDRKMAERVELALNTR